MSTDSRLSIARLVWRTVIFHPCRWVLAEKHVCNDLRDWLLLLCHSRNVNLNLRSTPNSFDNPPDFSNPPPQPQYLQYSYELCGNDAHHGYDCPPQIKDYRNERIDIQYRRECEIRIDELKQNFNGMSIENRKKEKELLQQEQTAYVITSQRFNFIDDDDDDDPIESVLNRDNMISSPKIDLLIEEFAGKLALIAPIPPGIVEADLDAKEKYCMRTRNSNFPNNSNVTIPRRRNKGRTPNVVEPELRTIVEVEPMVERTMEELLRAPTEGYGEAIVLPKINADHYEI
ncbi:hypothetical protein Tco_0514997 [Tanacetum coccineum]